MLRIFLKHHVTRTMLHAPHPMRPNFYAHLHPPTIPAEQARWRYTLGAGGVAVFLSLITLLTGALELFYYTPTPENAATSIQTLTYLVPFGGLIRNLHFWSAQFLVVISIVHLFRVVFTGAYTPPRRFNYLLGLALFIITVLLNFTGYILRWDVGIQWALVVGVNLIKTIPFFGENLYQSLVGGTQIGQPTLTHFYAWHLLGLGVISAILTVWHIFRVRRDGGVARPRFNLGATPKRIPRLELMRREVLAMIILSAILFVFATFLSAPIAAPIKEIGSISGSAKAPWFFLWVQEMLKWGDPFFWGILIPLFVLLFLILIPYIFPQTQDSELGRWFPKSNRLVQIILCVITLFIIILSFLAS